MLLVCSSSGFRSDFSLLWFRFCIRGFPLLGLLFFSLLLSGLSVLGLLSGLLFSYDEVTRYEGMSVSLSEGWSVRPSSQPASHFCQLCYWAFSFAFGAAFH